MSRTNRNTEEGDNPAELRGDIQRGRTGDKRPGFDPAVAPLETDSEAGGAALTPEQVRMAREGQPGEGRDASTSYGDAMRDFPGTPPKGGSPKAWLGIVTAIVLAGIAALILLT